MGHVNNIRHFPRARSATFVAAACLAFTHGPVAAEPRVEGIDLRKAQYVEDPMAPHETTGTTARLGSSVGFLYGERIDALALGIVAAGGVRRGRFALEAEYGYFQLSEKGPSNLVLGDAQRLGVIGRFEVIRLGSRIVGGNSMLAVFVEGGAGVAWNDWYLPGPRDAGRIVPEDTKRVEGLGGFGVMLDHRLQEPIGFPRRIGWFLGWRVAVSPHESDPASICRGTTCRPAPMMPHDRFVDRSMMFQSSLSFTW
jgi:hypothetical protein